MYASVIFVIKSVLIKGWSKIEKNFPAKINFTDGKTSKLDYYLEKNWIMQILFNLMKKKKMEDEFRQSLLNPDGVVKEIKSPA